MDGENSPLSSPRPRNPHVYKDGKDHKSKHSNKKETVFLLKMEKTVNKIKNTFKHKKNKKSKEHSEQNEQDVKSSHHKRKEKHDEE